MSNLIIEIPEGRYCCVWDLGGFKDCKFFNTESAECNKFNLLLNIEYDEEGIILGHLKCKECRNKSN